MKHRWKAAMIAASLLVGASALRAQGVLTGTLTGTVENEQGSMAGVTVEVHSPSLQGRRSAITNDNGAYNLPLLLPGEYEVTVTADGFESVKQTARVSAGQITHLDTMLSLAGLQEEIVVTGTESDETTISNLPQSSATVPIQLLEALPIARTPQQAVLLGAGVNSNGPSNGIVVSGSQSYESIYLVNGVVVNENLRGQALNLFIEDAVEETTTSTSAISAEYGRFAGGVISVITKSGGNTFKGSGRIGVTNERWVEPTALTRQRIDKDLKQYEATLGGRVLRDRLWFFTAGRSFENLGSGTTAAPTLLSFTTGPDQQRLEGKLTFAAGSGHRLVGTFLDLDQTDFGNFFTGAPILDLASVTDRKTPQRLTSGNYSGIFSPSFFVEAQYSERTFQFQNSGATSTDLVAGTLLIDGVTGARWNSPTFCGVCRFEDRNNENYLAKANYFLATEGSGSHDFVLGYDHYDDIRVADNHQSGSDYRIFITSTIIRGTDLFVQALGDESTTIRWTPILSSSRGTSFVTDSMFLNDRWRLNDRWSFNLGARFDKNDGKDSAGTVVADDSKLSPRLAASYDVGGDGDWIVNASYGEYVTALANNQGDSSSAAGNPANFDIDYTGPDINPDPNAPNLVPTDVAIRQLFQWLTSVGGHTGQAVYNIVVPGLTQRIPALDSPSTVETTLGVIKRLGSRGQLRVDLVQREGSDFYSLRTGEVPASSTVLLPSGRRADLTFLGNNDSRLERRYRGVHSQWNVRFADFNLGGTYTYSTNRGNFDGETAASGPVAAVVQSYPEYKDPSWNSPDGYLLSDQRHKLRLWGVWNAWTGDRHRLSLSFLQRFDSGQPYGAVGAVRTADMGVTNPGYASLPTTVAYYFTGRDAFRTDDISATDVAVNYSLAWKFGGRDLEVYLQPELINVFDEQGAFAVATGVQDATTTAGLARFNPFTTQTVEGVHWRKSSTFGQPRTALDIQTPRTFRFSIGLRF